MSTASARLLYWAPRLLSVLFITFVSMFALDVFGEHLGFPRVILALAIHLIPTAILTALLVVSWRWPWVGSVGFVALAVLYISQAHGVAHAYAIIYGPAILNGMLFLLDWLKREL